MIFALICSLLSGAALGAAGAVSSVSGDRVNVPSTPGTARRDVMQVSPHRRPVGTARHGRWVHAGIAGAAAAAGGIQGAPAPPAGEALVPSPAPRRAPEKAPTAAAVRPAAGRSAPIWPLKELSEASAPGPRGSALAEAATPGGAPDLAPVDLERFRDTVAYFNSRSRSIAGVDLFGEVAAIGGGTVQVRAGDGWARMPPAAQRSYLSTLLERWAAATGRADQLRVQIVDSSGQVLMEQSRR
jgi:hypothetical protein